MAKTKNSEDTAKTADIEIETEENTKAADEAVEKETSEQAAIDKDKYLRLAAEYDNFRKRSAKERETTYSDARTDAISRLLPVYDNLERALKMECTDEAYYKGVELIMQQLTEIFEDMGVRHIPAAGEPFDPNRHNAVMKIVDPNFGEGIITEEYQKGFTLGDRVIRFSTVVVAN
ncbi:MAG: nucleotide exchange factor GrpE [Oscillospiraceae bacterium]|nr:nucleotide exchange factor GrpE [Oscillospiraceae bacterium]